MLALELVDVLKVKLRIVAYTGRAGVIGEIGRADKEEPLDPARHPRRPGRL